MTTPDQLLTALKLVQSELGFVNGYWQKYICDNLKMSEAEFQDTLETLIVDGKITQGDYGVFINDKPNDQ